VQAAHAAFEPRTYDFAGDPQNLRNLTGKKVIGEQQD
jgi:hypothetical protein